MRLLRPLLLLLTLGLLPGCVVSAGTGTVYGGYYDAPRPYYGPRPYYRPYYAPPPPPRYHPRPYPPRGYGYYGPPRGYGHRGPGPYAYGRRW